MLLLTQVGACKSQVGTNSSQVGTSHSQVGTAGRQVGTKGPQVGTNTQVKQISPMFSTLMPIGPSWKRFFWPIANCQLPIAQDVAAMSRHFLKHRFQAGSKKSIEISVPPLLLSSCALTVPQEKVSFVPSCEASSRWYSFSRSSSPCSDQVAQLSSLWA